MPVVTRSQSKQSKSQKDIPTIPTVYAYTLTNNYLSQLEIWFASMSKKYINKSSVIRRHKHALREMYNTAKNANNKKEAKRLRKLCKGISF